MGIHPKKIIQMKKKKKSQMLKEDAAQSSKWLARDQPFSTHQASNPTPPRVCPTLNCSSPLASHLPPQKHMLVQLQPSGLQDPKIRLLCKVTAHPLLWVIQLPKGQSQNTALSCSSADQNPAKVLWVSRLMSSQNTSTWHLRHRRGERSDTYWGPATCQQCEGAFM
jgi:hypothetical protein